MSDIQNACLAKEWFYPFVLPNGQKVPSTHQHQLNLIHGTRTQMLNAFVDQHFGLLAEKKRLRLI